MNDRTHIGFKYLIEVITAGQVVDSFEVDNLMPTEGVNHLLNVAFKSGTQVTSWYLGLFEGDYTPTVGDTAATFSAAATETTAYASATRMAWTAGSVASGVLDNSALRAEFAFTAGKVIYGGFMTSAAAKGATSGALISVVRFPSPRTLDVDSILRVTAGITLTPI